MSKVRMFWHVLLKILKIMDKNINIYIKSEDIYIMSF